ncbi:Ssb Single-stranded DNA-binding protein [uncultured Caudovirales phage]|uniref:Single-stranded DNA-binding protein n=1 Tax=uncultured Caudovirales phage TaxID=2100421 RepID=A0A6J5STP2_9CAUD|nr:Ssb Single-stranded DNA-binding protein [uncultured Caudovirales phage]
MALPQVTIVGNLVDDPNLRFTPSGHAVCNFRVAAGERRQNKQTQEWEDGDTTFLSVTVWRELAENVADSLAKGDQVIAIGRLKQRDVDQNDGTKKTYFDLDAEAVGPSLARATGRLTKKARGGAVTHSTTVQDDPWAVTPTQSDEVPF